MNTSHQPDRRAFVWAAAIIATTAALALSVPPLRTLIEQGMAWHMVVQMPLLAAAGWLASRAVDSARSGPTRFNRFGLTGFMAVQCIAAYWMLPSAIDRAVVLPTADAAKVASLFAAGWWLRNSFQLAPPAVQLFFAGTTLPMAVWLGSYLASTDLRLCNAYSLQSQVNAGRGLAALALAAGIGWALHLRGWMAQRS